MRICLPMQGSQVWFLVVQVPTCHRATKPRVPQLLSQCSGAQEPQLLSPCAATKKAMRLQPVFYNKRSHCSEKPMHCNKEETPPPPATTRESLHAGKDPVEPKINKSLEKKCS